MKLKRIRIASFKRFRQPLELAGFGEGLNLFAAPNESGKSTVAEAIRAAFFERHRSSSVEHLKPWNESGATPQVELEFDLGGKPCRLVKAFLNRKRCELVIDGRAMDGVAAEDHLAGLLGFAFPGRGASQPEHMGIPGLLWIRQGGAHHIADEVRHAGDHLRTALGESMGELGTSSGDAVLRRVEAERNELLTAAGGQPRGVHAEAIAEVAALERELAGLQADIDAYRSAVDRLATLRRAHEREARERPWEAVAAQLAVAKQRLADAGALDARKAEAGQLLAQRRAQVAAARLQLETLARDEEALAQRQARLRAAQDTREHARAEVQAWEPRHAEAAAQDALARGRLATARQLAAFQACSQSAGELERQFHAARDALARAQQEQARVAQAQAEAAASQVADADLEELRLASQAMHEAQARLDAAATVLEFELVPGASLDVDGETMRGSGRRTLVARTEIAIAGVGRIGIAPGGGDLETRVAQRDRQRLALARLLQALGADSLVTVEARARLHAQRVAEVQAAQAVLRALAPKGLALLEAEVASLQGRLQAAQQQLREMAVPGPDGGTVPDVAPAEAAEAAARAELAAAAAALQAARLREADAQARLQAAHDELQAAQAAVDDPARASRKLQANAALVDALAQEQAAAGQLDAVVAQLKAANPALLQQDVARLATSVQQLDAAHAQQRNEIMRLGVELETKGALGLEEAAAEKQRQLDQARRRAAELKQRAAGLDYLLQALRGQRAELARRLRAPLQKHLNHYLDILFPGAAIEVGDDLSPRSITRAGPGGAESGRFEELSVGTREQMGIVARLAYADLLKEAGKPTLLILDDALVNSDEHRLGQMKRVLYDAAQRHQILVFTCHPDGWRDLGVPARPLE